MAPNENFFADNSTTRACRTCTDFKTWSQSNKTQIQNEKKEATGQSKHVHTIRSDCPIDKDQLGRSSWDFLHSLAAYYPDNPSKERQEQTKHFFNLFAVMYPCDVCSHDLQKQLERFPPKTNSQKELSQWLCRVHNRINLRLGKELFDCSKVDERWRDGWKDGSCD